MQGIRPAAGYPSQPDHSEKLTLWRVLGVKENCRIELTDTLAMSPAASVSGLYFAHPKAEYFSVGKLCPDQVCSYHCMVHRYHIPTTTSVHKYFLFMFVFFRNVYIASKLSQT